MTNRGSLLGRAQTTRAGAAATLILGVLSLMVVGFVMLQLGKGILALGSQAWDNFIGKKPSVASSGVPRGVLTSGHSSFAYQNGINCSNIPGRMVERLGHKNGCSGGNWGGYTGPLPATVSSKPVDVEYGEPKFTPIDVQSYFGTWKSDDPNWDFTFFVQIGDLSPRNRVDAVVTYSRQSGGAKNVYLARVDSYQGRELILIAEELVLNRIDICPPNIIISGISNGFTDGQLLRSTVRGLRCSRTLKGTSRFVKVAEETNYSGLPVFADPRSLTPE